MFKLIRIDEFSSFPSFYIFKFVSSMNHLYIDSNRSYQYFVMILPEFVDRNPAVNGMKRIEANIRLQFSRAKTCRCSVQGSQKALVVL